MNTKQNGKLAPFQIGQNVRHISADNIVRTVLWASKGASNRSEQVIVTNYDSNPVEADIYMDAE